ncbi:hypothetical protein J7M22_16080 [Candidatus Poribacteria bacterium]|nr:hypothetical protein [Candidatus Poribacteria bacterium]
MSLYVLSLIFTLVLTNGGFEKLGPGGFPAGWTAFCYKGQMGKDALVEVTGDSFEGEKALRMKSFSKTACGLNRRYPTLGKGKRIRAIGDLLPVKKGGFTFRYKLIETKGDNVRFYVIPMGEDNFETASRATYVLPRIFAGDGRWHIGVIAFDYSDSPDVRSVQVAPRINEGGEPGPGEVIFDNIRYLEVVGWHLRVEDIRLIPDPDNPAASGVIEIEVDNTGDDPAPVNMSLSSPDKLTFSPLDLPESVNPGERVKLKWAVAGLRSAGSRISVRWNSYKDEEERFELILRPEVKLVGFGPSETVLQMRGEYELRLSLANLGGAISGPVQIEIDVPQTVELKEGERSLRIESLNPGRTEFWWKIRPSRPGIGAFRVKVYSKDLRGPSEAEFTAICTEIPEEKSKLRLRSGGLELLFPENPFGYGLCAVRVKSEGRMGVIPWLGMIVYLTKDGERRKAYFYADRFTLKGESIAFKARHTDEDGVNWDLTATFTPDGNGQIKVDLELNVDKPRKLLAFHGPRLLVGEGNFGEAYDEAVLPGIYYMEPPETSLDTTFSDPPYNDQHAPHPYKVTAPVMAVRFDSGLVGLMWDPLQRWDGENIAPSCLFASPNWVGATLPVENPTPEKVLFQDEHLLGLFLPSIPKWVRENTQEAENPYELKPGKRLRLRCWILGEESYEITDAILAYLDRFGLPDLPEKPRSYEETLRMCDKPSRPAGRFGRLFGFINDLEGRVMDDLEAQAEDGSWKFRMDPRNTELLAKFAPNHKDLGPQGDTTLGTCTFGRRRAIALWRYLRLTEDETVRNRADKAIQYVDDNFARPEGAQTWEVPLHCPDILAAGYGIQLYLEAFKATGDERYLDRARYWARTGLPFIYLWRAPDRPSMMLFADIPVLGSSFFKMPWFGKPVQWCGLAYATDLQRLAYVLDELGEREEAKFWRHIAEGITICGMQMQIEEGPRRGNYPDSVSLTYQYKRNDPGIINPHLIVQNIWMLTHPDEGAVDFFTRVLRTDRGEIHVNAEAKITDARIDGEKLIVRLRTPLRLKGIASQIVISPVSNPTSLLKGGREIQPSAGGKGDWWRYDRRGKRIEIQVIHDSPEIEVEIDGVRFEPLEGFPVCSEPDWNFEVEGDPEGWSPAHDLTPFTVKEGKLRTRSMGGDPYMIGPPMKVEAKEYGELLIRARVKAPEGIEKVDGQLFWSRSDSSGFSESKSLHFVMRCDGEFHLYRVKLAGHPEWRGKIIRLRLDPGNVSDLEIEIDQMRLK